MSRSVLNALCLTEVSEPWTAHRRERGGTWTAPYNATTGHQGAISRRQRANQLLNWTSRASLKCKLDLPCTFLSVSGVTWQGLGRAGDGIRQMLLATQSLLGKEEDCTTRVFSVILRFSDQLTSQSLHHYAETRNPLANTAFSIRIRSAAAQFIGSPRFSLLTNTIVSCTTSWSGPTHFIYVSNALRAAVDAIL